MNTFGQTVDEAPEVVGKFHVSIAHFDQVVQILPYLL
jgi:hypothetical protein